MSLGKSWALINSCSLFQKLALCVAITGIVSEGIQDLLVQYLQLVVGFNTADQALLFTIIGAANLVVQVRPIQSKEYRTRQASRAQSGRGWGCLPHRHSTFAGQYGYPLCRQCFVCTARSTAAGHCSAGFMDLPDAALHVCWDCGDWLLLAQHAPEHWHKVCSHILPLAVNA
jgi:hypothetical protein